MLTPQEHEDLHVNLEKFLQGVPLPYILSRWEFYGRNFKVTPDVLIPRPETEMLVELALKHAQNINSYKVVDIGTGSGCIAISLAAELPAVTVTAVDLSIAALLVAKENAKNHNQTHIHFIQADLLSPFSARFDLICANLPYIPSDDLNNLPVSQWEPRLALDGGKSGMETIWRLLDQAKTRVAPNGLILLEIESNLGKATLSAAKKVFPNATIHLIPDLAGLDRIIKIQLTGDLPSQTKEPGYD